MTEQSPAPLAASPDIPGKPASGNTARLLRSLIFITIWSLFTLLWACICLIFCWLPYPKRYYLISRWNIFTIWLLETVCDIRYQIKGLENIPDGRVIILAKHQSAWETIFMLAHLKRPVAFVLKKELLLIPFFGWTLRLLRMIPIDRKNKTRAVRQLVALGNLRLEQGLCIIIFPEGTRVAPGKKGTYQQGGTLLAVKTGAHIVPVAHNAGEYWPKNTLVKKPGQITLSIGTAIAPDNHPPGELMRQVENWIETEMRNISPHHYR